MKLTHALFPVVALFVFVSDSRAGSFDLPAVRSVVSVEPSVSFSNSVTATSSVRPAVESFGSVVSFVRVKPAVHDHSSVLSFDNSVIDFSNTRFVDR